MSVQASSRHCSTPRNDEGPYTHVEVGFPSFWDKRLDNYIEVPGEDPHESIYPYVPYDLVLEIINEHKGVAKGKLPNVDVEGLIDVED